MALMTAINRVNETGLWRGSFTEAHKMTTKTHFQILRKRMKKCTKKHGKSLWKRINLKKIEKILCVFVIQPLTLFCTIHFCRPNVQAASPKW